jgi:hypothetical protein
MMDKETCIRLKDDRTMLLNPEWWPTPILMRAPVSGPCIALKHRTIRDPIGFPRHGRLAMTPSRNGQRFTVFQIDDNDPMRFADTTIYDTVDDVLAAGWIID